MFDAEGHTVLPRPGAAALAPDILPERVEQVRWGDGASRVTCVARAEPSGWSVAVGMPAPEGSPAGRSMLLLAAAWAVTLAASCVLAVWAVGRFTKPLQSLAAAASTLGEGNLNERARVACEIGLMHGLAVHQHTHKKPHLVGCGRETGLRPVRRFPFAGITQCRFEGSRAAPGSQETSPSDDSRIIPQRQAVQRGQPGR